MINLYSVNATTNAMRLLKQANLKLTADEGSPIHILNKATSQQSVLDSSITDEQFFQNLPQITALKQPVAGTGESNIVVDTAAGAESIRVEDHEPTLFALKRTISQRCAGMLDFSRNVIQPFVQEVLKNNQISPVEEVKEDWQLVPVDTDPCINEPVVQALISKLSNPTGAGFNHDPIEVAVPDVVDVPETGRKSFDQLINTLLTELGWSMSEALRVMCAGNAIIPNSAIAPGYMKQNVLFLLLSAYYLENPWPNTGVSLDRWKTLMTKAHYSYCGWVYLYAEAIVVRTKLGNIVYSYDADKKQVFICQEAMDDYLNSHGSVEALLGALYQLDDGDTTASTNKASLLEKQDAYVAAWDRRSSIRRMGADTDWLTTNRQSLKMAFALAIDTLDPAYLSSIGENKQLTPAEAKTAVNSAIDHLFTRGTTDITAFIIRTACCEVFGEYDLCALMLCIHEGMVEGQKPDAIASGWIANYILDWLLMGILIEQ